MPLDYLFVISPSWVKNQIQKSQLLWNASKEMQTAVKQTCSFLFYNWYCINMDHILNIFLHEQCFQHFISAVISQPLLPTLAFENTNCQDPVYLASRLSLMTAINRPQNMKLCTQSKQNSLEYIFCIYTNTNTNDNYVILAGKFNLVQSESVLIKITDKRWS